MLDVPTRPFEVTLDRRLGSLERLRLQPVALEQRLGNGKVARGATQPRGLPLRLPADPGNFCRGLRPAARPLVLYRGRAALVADPATPQVAHLRRVAPAAIRELGNFTANGLDALLLGENPPVEVVLGGPELRLEAGPFVGAVAGGSGGCVALRLCASSVQSCGARGRFERPPPKLHAPEPL